MSAFCVDHYRGNPPVHPIARHAGHAQESLRITSILSDAFLDIRSWWQARRQRRIDRMAFEHMLALDDAILKDIGVSRADVIWARSLPLSQNAAAELEILARQNKAI